MLPKIIGNYLDNSTSYPSVTSSFNHRGKMCNTECKIVETNLNRCGDGILGKLEQCDLGPNMPTPVGNYLDTTTNYPAGIYANKATCSENCTLDGVELPEMPACWYGDTIISVMKDEIFPFSWDIELPETDLVSSCNDSASEGKIVKDSLRCDFRIYNRNGEINGPERLRNIPCFTDTWGSSRLFEQFRIGSDGIVDPLFVEDPIGTYHIDSRDFERMVGKEL